MISGKDRVGSHHLCTRRMQCGPVQGAKPHAPKTAIAIALERKRWFDKHAGVCAGQELHCDDQAQQLHQGTTTTVLGSAQQVLELFEPRLVRQISIVLGGIQCILQDYT